MNVNLFFDLEVLTVDPAKFGFNQLEHFKFSSNQNTPTVILHHWFWAYNATLIFFLPIYCCQPKMKSAGS